MMRSVSVVGWSYKNVLSRMFKPSLWPPFLILAAFQAAILLTLVYFYQPWAQPVGVPLLRMSGGEGALHYPFTYTALPVAVARGEMFVGILVASVTSAAATLLFAAAFGRGVGDSPWTQSFKRYPALLLYGVVLTILVLGVFLLQSLVPRNLMLEDRTVRWGTRLGSLFLAILVQCFLAYGTPWIILRGKGFVAAMTSSIQFARKNFVPTFFLVSIPVLLKYPLSWIQGRSDLFVSKFQPETISAVLWFDIALEALLSFMLIGTLTFFFLWKQEAKQ